MLGAFCDAVYKLCCAIWVKTRLRARVRVGFLECAAQFMECATQFINSTKGAQH